MVDDSRDLEDFDFDFIDSTIKSSAEEMSGSLEACVAEIKNNVQEAELIDGTQDLVTQLNGQVAAVSALQEQFSEFLKRTGYVQDFARQKSEELDEVKVRMENKEKASESTDHKIGYLEEEIRRSKMQHETHEQHTAQMEQEIEELRQEVQAKEAMITEHKESQIALEQLMEETKEAKSGQEDVHALDTTKLKKEMTDIKHELWETRQQKEDLQQRCSEYEAKIQDQENLQAMLTKKFEEWEKVFKAELEKARDKAEFYRCQMDNDQQQMNDTIEKQEEEIKELKLKLTSKDLELKDGQLQYDLAQLEDGNDQTIDEGEEGEESKYAGLSGEFGREADSRVEGDMDHSGMPLVEGEPNELSELGGAGDMMGAGNVEAEYAEIDTGAQNDIFEQDNYDECDKMAIINRQTLGLDNASQNSASTISQKWEADARKDPEEEYFRLSCLALKIIYNEQDTDFVFTVSPGKLYAKCKKQKIPFHLWYTWIEKELQKVNDLQKRAVEASTRPKSLMERIQGAIFTTRTPHR